MQAKLFQGIAAGGVENVGFLSRDLDNYRRDERKLLEGHDADFLLSYFKSKTIRNSGFKYKYTICQKGRLFNCFWTDTVSCVPPLW